MAALKVIAWIVLVLSVAWFAYEPGFEPAIGIFLALSTLVGLLHHKKTLNDATRTQNQNVSGKSVGIQVGGDVRVEPSERQSDDQ